MQRKYIGFALMYLVYLISALTLVLLAMVLLPKAQAGDKANDRQEDKIEDTTDSTVDTVVGSVVDRVADRFSVPEGFRRVQAGPFAAYLRNLPLKPKGSRARLHSGAYVRHGSVAAVVDMDIGPRDLQQCADTAIRLYADFERSQGREKALSFTFTSGHSYAYQDYLGGKRPKVSGQTVTWVKTKPTKNSETAYRAYLDQIYMYAGTASLARDLKSYSVAQAQIGDLFINPGFPGHAAMIVDIVVNQKGERMAMLVQGYLPAQDVHIVKDITGDVWFKLGRPLTSDTFFFKGDRVFRF